MSVPLRLRPGLSAARALELAFALACVAAAFLAAACDQRAAPADTASGALDRAAVAAPSSSIAPADVEIPRTPVTRPLVLAPTLPKDPAPAPKEPPPPEDDTAPPSPPARALVLAPPSEDLILPADLSAQMAKEALARRDGARRAAFLDGAGFAAVRGMVVRADEKIVETKDSGWMTATAYQVSRLRSWPGELPDTVEVWVRGGRSTGGGEATPDFHQQRRTSEPTFEIGQEVLLSLRKAPLYAGDEARTRVARGRAGALTAPADVEAYAKLLDERFGGKGK